MIFLGSRIAPAAAFSSGGASNHHMITFQGRTLQAEVSSGLRAHALNLHMCLPRPRLAGAVYNSRELIAILDALVSRLGCSALPANKRP